jgi:hypothetical protein
MICAGAGQFAKAAEKPSRTTGRRVHMISPEQKKRILDMLWPQVETTATPQVYALVDGARDPRIEPLVRMSWHSYECLFSGNLSPQLRAASPYLVLCSANGRFVGSLLDQGWGQSWGVFVITPADVSIGQLRKHFRNFFQVQDEAGRRLFFRFYDPRVLSVYLPTCTQLEARQFMGPALRIIMEDPEPGMIRVCSLERSGVKMDEVSCDPGPAVAA